MSEVTFHVTGASAPPFTASPQIALHVEVRTGNPEESIESILLRCTTRIQASSRTHDAEERTRLEELLGDEGVWARSARSLLWAQATTVVPRFVGTTSIDVLLPCGYDLATAASKYLHGITRGDVPITAQFSGTVFRAAPAGLQISQIPWDREASHRVPLELWQRVIDEHFPNSGVLSLRRDVFDRLNRYRRDHGLLRWEDAVERLLGSAVDGASS